MINNPTTIQQKKLSWRKAFDLIKDYFVNSDQRLIAWLYLIGIVLSAIGLVALITTFSWWSVGFWGALAAKEFSLFVVSMEQFALIISAYVGVSVLENYLTGKLSLLWRNWLTNKILNQLFDEANYLYLKRISAEIDNVSQRIQEDIQSFVTLTLTLGIDFLKSVLSLGAFIGTLWVVGGTLSFAMLGLNMVIPGYLVWVALILAIAATITTHLIAKSLAQKNKKGERAEANLRKDLELLNSEAENIAQEHAENYYKESLKNKVKDIYDNASQKLDIQTKLVAFQSFYMQMSAVLPYLLAAPLYFTGLIELGQLMQVGIAFGEVNLSLSWFLGAYEDLANYKTSIERITELQQTFEKNSLADNPKSIIRKEENLNNILHIKQLNLMQPRVSSTQYMMRNLNLTLIPGEHILIKGPSGLGKSTLFKAISGTWKYGNGEITVPAAKRLLFLPQKPTLPHDTLMAVLAYPEPANTYTEAQYIAVLKMIGGMDTFLSQLQEKRSWSELSGGEQQRISFARALLKKPDWLFLDEATASLDEESEQHLYTVIKELRHTTIVSIAHRATVEKHHSRIVYFKANKEKEINVEELTRAGFIVASQ